jgi:predicted peroxiredoxin
MHSIHLKAQTAFIAAAHTLTEEKDNLVVKGSKSNDLIVKEYQKRIKKLTMLAEKAGSHVKDRKSALKKLGVEESQCESGAADSSST